MPYCWIQHSCIPANMELLTGASTARRLSPADWQSWYRNVFCILLQKKIILNIIQLQTLGQRWPISTMDWSNIGVSPMAVSSHFLTAFKASPEDGHHYWHCSCGQGTEWKGLRLQENLLLLFCYSKRVNKMSFGDILLHKEINISNSAERWSPF